MTDPKHDKTDAKPSALTFEPMPSTHKDHQPVADGPFLLLRNVESPNPFIKRGHDKVLRTGIKLVVPENHLCVVADRHPVSRILQNLQYLQPGTSGEVSVLCSAGHQFDRNVRMGQEIGAAWLVRLDGAKFPPKVESNEDGAK